MPANPPGASVEGAASRIASLFSEPSEPTEPQGQAEPQSAVAETQQEAETPQGDTKPNRRVKAKLDDLEVEFDVITEGVDPELIPKGLLMERDYRKKTSEVAEQRRALEAKDAEIQEQLKDLEEMLYGEAAELDSPEMQELKELDPSEYLKKRDKFEQKAKKLKGYKDNAQKELEKKQNELIKAEMAKYSEAIPDWMDEGSKSKDLAKMASYLKDVGFSEVELGSIYDHRLIKAFRDAALFQELKNTPVDNKRVKSAPRHQSPGHGDKEPETSANDKARQRLKKSGKIQDAQAAFKAYLGG